VAFFRPIGIVIVQIGGRRLLTSRATFAFCLVTLRRRPSTVTQTDSFNTATKSADKYFRAGLADYRRGASGRACPPGRAIADFVTTLRLGHVTLAIIKLWIKCYVI